MAGDEIENIKVAVRVRPFNKREIARNAKRIIDVNGNSTKITNPDDGESKSFTFDHSYWSFDGCKEEKNGYCSPDPSHPNGKKFCDQVSGALKYKPKYIFYLFIFLYSISRNGSLKILVKVSWTMPGKVTMPPYLLMDKPDRANPGPLSDMGQTKESYPYYVMNSSKESPRKTMAPLLLRSNFP